MWLAATDSQATPDEQKPRICFEAIFMKPSADDPNPTSLLSRVRRFVNVTNVRAIVGATRVPWKR
eukprot:5846924-Lingulodinium_polyedra.AAC.1